MGIFYFLLQKFNTTSGATPRTPDDMNLALIKIRKQLRTMDNFLGSALFLMGKWLDLGRFF